MITSDALARALEPDVLAAQRGDRDAFVRLVDASRNVVCSVTLAIVRDVARSEDIAQEVFVAAWKGLGKLRSAASFLPWIRQLARNHANMAIRSAIRYRRRHAPWNEGVDAADAAASAPLQLIAHEEEAALAAALTELPDETREVVTLFYREGQSARQVGELLGMTEPAVKKRLERAREALREATLARLGEVARRTAPTAGFTLAVTAAIAIGAPGTAAAATGLAKSPALAGPLAKLFAVIGGALLGGAAALVAIVRGAQIGLRDARDAEERRGVLLLAATNLVALVAAIGAGQYAIPADAPAWLAAAPYLGFALVTTSSYAVWLPRIVARRLAAEREEDPRAEARQLRDRRRAKIGITLGLVFAIAGIAAGLWLR